MFYFLLLIETYIIAAEKELSGKKKTCNVIPVEYFKLIFEIGCGYAFFYTNHIIKHCYFFPH